MAQHDYDIANQSGANFRADLNNALDAIVSNNSGSSEPSTKFAYEWWIDTSNNLLKLRNSANNAWITLPLSITADNATSGALTVNGNLSTTGTVDINGQELILDADADTSITADTDDQIDFKIGNVDVATLTNSNLVLKGTTPTLTIGDAGAEDTKIVFDGNAQDFYIGLDDSADDLVIGTGSTVGTNGLVVIENGGNVGINTLTPTFRLDVNGSLSSNGNENVMRIAGSDTNNAGGITINNVFGASASSRVSTLFSIDGQDQASPLAFGNGTSEAIRIDESGNLLLNTTDKTGGGQLGTSRFCLKINGAGDNGILVHDTRTSSGTDNALVFVRGSSTVGTIQTSTTATAFNTSSDYRLKENIQPMVNGLERVNKLKPSKFNWKETGESSEGFIAHEVQEAGWLEGVSGNKDDEQMQMVDYGKITPLLVKAIQEQQDIINNLKSRIETLEG